jgi:hypothetical protein
MTCEGDPNEKCGGPNRLNMYQSTSTNTTVIEACNSVSRLEADEGGLFVSCHNKE